MLAFLLTKLFRTGISCTQEFTAPFPEWEITFPITTTQTSPPLPPYGCILTDIAMAKPFDTPSFKYDYTNNRLVIDAPQSITYQP